jgi:flagellar motor switch protein FliG
MERSERTAILDRISEQRRIIREALGGPGKVAAKDVQEKARGLLALSREARSLGVSDSAIRRVGGVVEP